MGEVIKKAIPVSQVAKDYLKNNKARNNFDIEADVAKELLNNNVVSHQSDFVCATEGCTAPITCCSYKRMNKKAPYYKNHYEKQNKHAEHCMYHPNKYEYREQKVDDKNKKYIDRKNNKVISRFSSRNGFEPPKSSNKKQGNDSSISNSTEIESRTRSIKGSNQKRYRKISENKTSLQYHAEMFESNPNMMIVSYDTGREIPIEYLFKSIQRNTLFDKNSEELSYIYYGDAWVNEQDDTTFRINFIDEININEKQMKPSFFVKINDLKSVNKEVLEAFKQKSNLICRVYITYKFYIHSSKGVEYLNFAEFVTGARLSENTKHLKHNIYMKVKRRKYT